MKKLTFLLSILIILISCKKSINDIACLNKSIFEPLNATEINEVIGIDSAFYSTYKIITLNNIRFNDELERAKYIDITYKQFHDFLSYMKNVESKISEKDFSSEIHDKNDSLYVVRDKRCFDYLDFTTLYFHKKLPCEQEPNMNTDYNALIDTISVVDTGSVVY